MKLLQQIFFSTIVGTTLVACNTGANSVSGNNATLGPTTRVTHSSVTESEAIISLFGNMIQTSFQDSTSKNLYAGTPNGLFISTDAGKNWIQKTTVNGLLSNNVQSVAVVGSNIYLIAGGFAMVSHDNGNTWGHLLEHVTPDFDSIYANGSNIYLGYHGDNDLTQSDLTKYKVSTAGIAISTDGGKGWYTNPIISGTGRHYAYEVNSLYVEGGNIYFIDKHMDNLVFSSDYGVTWKIRNFVGSYDNVPLGAGATELEAVVASGDNILVASNAGVSISTDHGNSFSLKNTNNGLGANTVHSVALGSDNRMFAGTSNGLSVSNDNGAHFANYIASTANQIAGPNIYSLNGKGSSLLVGTGNGMSLLNNTKDFYFAKDSNNTQNMVNGKYMPITSKFSSRTRIYTANYGSGLLVYDKNMTLLKRLDKNNGISPYISAIYADNDSTNIYLATTSGLDISNDGGASWHSKTTADGLASSQIFSIAGDGSNIYAGSYGGGLSISNDKGNTWHTVKPSGGQDIIYNIVSSAGKLYATVDQLPDDGSHKSGLYVSQDGGANWTVYLSGKNVHRVFVADKALYVTADDGIWISYDGSSSWSLKNKGFSGYNTNSIYVSAGIIYVGLIESPDTTSQALAGSYDAVAVSSDGGNSFSTYYTLDKVNLDDSTKVFSILQVNGKIMLGTSNAGVLTSSL